jgi:isoleucyl-tRNA synthetase
MQIDLSKAENVLDRWIAAAARSLTRFVRQEMEAYRLYTVVPFLVQFIDNLTNIYVRYNRKRLKVRLSYCQPGPNLIIVKHKGRG